MKRIPRSLERLVRAAAAVAMLAGCSDGPATGRRGARGGFTFVVIGRTRPGVRIVEQDPAHVSEHYLDNVRLVNAVRGCGFVVNLGDAIAGGAREPGLAERQWDSYDRATAQLDCPSRLVAGEDDVWDERSAEAFRRRYGELYKSFDGGGCHFIVLSTEVPGEAGTVGREQREWLERDLAAARPARKPHPDDAAASGRKPRPDDAAGEGGKGDEKGHLFVFLHRPLWSGRSPKAAVETWMNKIHPLLKRHGVDAVFAGHDGFYEFERVDGVRYVVTGAGGAEPERPPGLGGVHHFVRVDVPPEGAPRLTVVVNDAGVAREHPEDFVRADVARVATKMRKDTAVRLASEAKATIKVPLENPLGEGIAMSFGWESGGDASRAEPAPVEPARVEPPRVEPPHVALALAPGERRELAFDLDLADPNFVLPALAWAIVGRGRTLASGRFTPHVRRYGRYARAPASVVVTPLAITAAGQVVLGAEGWTGPGDSSAECSVARGEDGIRIRVEVTDDVMDSAAESIRERDSVELYFDFRPKGGRGPAGTARRSGRRGRKGYGRGVFRVTVGAGDGSLLVDMHEAASGQEGVTGLVAASERTAEGYRVTVFVPFSGLKEKHHVPGPGFGFDFGVNDADGKGSRESHLMWSGTRESHGAPSSFGRLRPAEK